MGDDPRAATLFGAFDAQRQATGASIPALFRQEYEHRVAEARARLGDGAFAQAWTTGQAMTMEQAVRFTLAE